MERYDISVVENAVNTSSICQVNLYDKVIASCMKDYLEYRKAEEQGLLLKLPCPIGTTVYEVAAEYGGNCDGCDGSCTPCTNYSLIIIEFRFSIEHLDKIGKEIFLTKKEAEEKLKELQS